MKDEHDGLDENILGMLYNRWISNQGRKDLQKSGAYTEGGVVYVDDSSPTG